MTGTGSATIRLSGWWPAAVTARLRHPRLTRHLPALSQPLLLRLPEGTPIHEPQNSRAARRRKQRRTKPVNPAPTNPPRAGQSAEPRTHHESDQRHSPHPRIPHPCPLSRLHHTNTKTTTLSPKPAADPAIQPSQRNPATPEHDPSEPVRPHPRCCPPLRPPPPDGRLRSPVDANSPPLDQWGAVLRWWGYQDLNLGPLPYQGARQMMLKSQVRNRARLCPHLRASTSASVRRHSPAVLCVRDHSVQVVSTVATSCDEP